MTVYSFESGTPGATAQAGDGDLLTVVPGSGNTVKFGSAASDGAVGLEFTIGGAYSCWCEIAGEQGAGTTESKLLCIRLSPDGYNSSGGGTPLWQQLKSDNTTTVCRLTVTNTGALTVADQSGAHTNTLVADISGRYGNWIYVRLQLNSGTTTTNGVYTARYYTDLGAPVGSPVAQTTASNWNLGAGGTFGKTRFGVNSGQVSVGSGGRKTVFDYIVNAVGTSWIASPEVVLPPTAPTANAGGDAYGQAGGPITLNGSGTVGTSGGSISNYAWSLVSRSNTTMSTPTIGGQGSASPNLTGADEGVYVYQLVVTQTGGGLVSPADQVTVWVHPPDGQPAGVFSVVKAAGVIREGAAGADADALTDASDSTRLRWPDSPSGQVVTVRWNPCGEGTAAFQFDGVKVGSGPAVNVTVNHFREDGATLLDGPYTWAVGGQGTFPAGLSPAALTALGGALSDRRQLVTTIRASG